MRRRDRVNHTAHWPDRLVDYASDQIENSSFVIGCLLLVTRGWLDAEVSAGQGDGGELVTGNWQLGTRNSTSVAADGCQCRCADMFADVGDVVVVGQAGLNGVDDGAVLDVIEALAEDAGRV